MKTTKPFDSFKEMHINIEDAHFTLLTDRGIDKLGFGEKKDYAPLHFHSFYEVFYIRDGSLKIKFENSKAEFNKNSLVILPPKNIHSSILKNDNSSRYCISFFVSKNNLKTENSFYDIVSKMLLEECVCIENATQVYESIKNISENITYGNHFKISFYFYEFILALMDITGHLKPGTPEELLSDNSISRTYKIQRIISSYYMHDISLEFIAKNLFLSTRQVNRIVQSFYGCTYREIIMQTRIKAAAELLTTGSMTVSEISSMVGYQSLRGFYSAFKKFYGCLPTEYRSREKASSSMA